MSDNTTVDNGALTDYAVAADEVSYSGNTVLAQLIRLVHITGSEGSRTVVEISDARGAWVVPRRDLVRVAVTSGGLTTSASAYAAGDQVGTQFTFAGCARASGGSGTIVGAVLISAADTTGSFDLIMTDSSITLSGGDNGAFAISDADALKIVCVLNLVGSFDIGGNRVAQAFNIAYPYVCSGGTSLYGGLMTRSAIAATPFANATDIQVALLVELN